MTTLVKATDPERRMGIYKRLDEVPTRYRLQNHEPAYTDRDVWAEYLDSLTDPTENQVYRESRAGRRWKTHMEQRGRHHALAIPLDVDTYCEALLDSIKTRTAYEQYWVALESFYSWLQYHTDHPHVYHPVLMAALAHDSAGEIWAYKIGTGRERARKRAEENTA